MNNDAIAKAAVYNFFETHEYFDKITKEMNKHFSMEDESYSSYSVTSLYLRSTTDHKE